MNKKRKYLSVLIMLFLILNSVVCYADTSVKGGYYRLRNYASGMYLNYDDSFNLTQKSFSSYYLPPSFLIANTEGYKNSYTIHPKTYPYFGLKADNSLQSVVVSDSYFEDMYLWNFNYANNGAFEITSDSYGKYMGVGDGNISKNGSKIYLTNKGTVGSEKWFLEKNIEDGVYKIKNKSTGKYLTANGTSLSLADNNNSNSQKFKIRSYSDGYSDIMPYSNTNYSISVSGWDRGEDKENANVILMAGQSSEGQMWRFLVNKNGSFRMMSQLSNCNKCIAFKNNTLCSCTYVDRGVNNEWELEQVSSDAGGKNVYIAAFWEKNDGSGSLDRRNIVTPIKNYYQSQNAATKVTCCTALNNSLDLLNAMQNNQVVSISSHGEPSRIVMYDSSGEEKESLKNDAVYDLADRKLSNIKICLISGCSTAAGSGSITEAIYDKGAKCAIGFTKTTYRPMSCTWAQAFNEMVAKGGDVDLSLWYADWRVMSNHSSTGETDSYKAFGNTSIIYGD